MEPEKFGGMTLFEIEQLIETAKNNNETEIKISTATLSDLLDKIDELESDIDAIR